MRKLTERQKRFVEEYMIDSNATNACIRAGYTKTNADVVGPKLLGNIGVITEIRKRQAKQSERLGITRDFITKELLDILNATKISFPPSALKALEMLAKMHGLNEPDRAEVFHQGIVVNLIKPNNGNSNNLLNEPK